MSKYTTEVRFICETLAGLTESEGFDSIDDIIEKSKQIKVKYSKDIINFITVSRLAPEKAFERTLLALKNLKDEGFKFCWHILGDGDLKKSLEGLIDSYKLIENITFYGNVENPYPYIKDSDYYWHIKAGEYMFNNGILKFIEDDLRIYSREKWDQHRKLRIYMLDDLETDYLYIIDKGNLELSGTPIEVLQKDKIEAKRTQMS